MKYVCLNNCFSGSNNNSWIDLSNTIFTKEQTHRLCGEKLKIKIVFVNTKIYILENTNLLHVLLLIIFLLPSPISPGLISLWMKFLLWMNSMRPIIWSANMRTVFMVKRRLQKLNKSSSEGPNKSITKILYCCSWPNHLERTRHHS